MGQNQTLTRYRSLEGGRGLEQTQTACKLHPQRPGIRPGTTCFLLLQHHSVRACSHPSITTTVLHLNGFQQHKNR